MIKELNPLIFIYLIVFCATLTMGSLSAQGTLEDYKRSETLDTLYRGKVYNSPNSFTWVDDKSYAWYENTSESGTEYILVNAESATQGPAFDHEKLAIFLNGLFETAFEANKLNLDDLEFDLDSNKLSFQIDSAVIEVSLADYSGEVVDIDENSNRGRRGGYWGSRRSELEGEPVESPDKKWEAIVEDYNVVVTNKESKEKFQLSYDGTKGTYYSSSIKWSPDSKQLVAYKIDPAEESKIYFVESSPENQLQPVLQERDYLKPGDKMSQRYPQLFDVEKKKHMEVPIKPILDQFGVNSIEWREDSRYFTFEYNQRGHQTYQVLKVDRNGNLSTLINETSPTFIDYSGKKFRRDLEDTNEIIWASERDGWNHLYLYDSETGKVKNQITKGNWVVRDVVYVDKDKREIIFEASGLDKDQDPYFIQYCKVGFDGKGFTRLTKENGTHDADFSDDYSYFIDQYSRVDSPPVAVLRSTDKGKILLELQKADISKLEATGWNKPEVFTAKARDGKTDIWGIIVRPSNFDPNKTYPVIEYIYAGPHSSFVPKGFRPYLWNHQAMAELGFIVVQIDGMGTSNRSKAFHDVCYQNLKDAGFPDRKLWIKAAGQKYSYMDTERVGIFGTSAGGQNSAGALVFHSDFYDVAVSSCGCHDNRMDKVWWNEQWMGKIGPHYAESSNIENADKMGGNLMLIVGELDDNVDPATTMQFVNELVKRRKDFELVVIPGAGHTSGGEFGNRKRKDFFVKQLLGVDPPSWSDVYAD